MTPGPRGPFPGYAGPTGGRRTVDVELSLAVEGEGRRVVRHLVDVVDVPKVQQGCALTVRVDPADRSRVAVERYGPA